MKDCVPVYILLRDYQDEDDRGKVSIEELINRTFNLYIEDCDLRKAITDQKLLEQNKLIVLLDGIDEIKDERTRKKINDTIDKFIIRNPHCKIIITSRPINLKREDYPKFVPLDINPLTQDMYTDYIKKWFADRDEKVNTLLNILNTKPRITELAGNPFLLSMVCFTFNTEEIKIIERRSELYKVCTEELLKRAYDVYDGQDRFTNTQYVTNPQSFEQIIETLKYISFLYSQWQEGEFIDDYVTIMGKRNPRIEKVENTIQLLENLEKDTGIIQRTEKGFRFIHRSLLEYFTALALLDKDLEVAIHYAAHPKWEEVIRLYAGLLSNEKKKDKMEGLIKGLWTINRPLALRTTTEVNISAYDLIKPLIDKEEDSQGKKLLIDSLEQSLPLIDKTQHETLVNETLRIFLIECKEKDCEVIYKGHNLLERLHMKPVEKGGLIYELFDLDNAQKRQKDLLQDQKNLFQWIEIKGGTFLMGDNEGEKDESPEHLVTVHNFFLAKHPVTNRMMKETNFPFGNRYPDNGGESNPAIGNTWFEAYYFALWFGARLPTEAEWEYAARGGTKSKGYKYSGSDTIEDVAWYQLNSKGASHPIGEKTPNELDLYDMSGNVYEWCIY